MSNLNLFMKKNKRVRENEKYAATKDLVDEKGNVLEWEIKPVTTKENEYLRDSCTREVPVPGRRGQVRQKLDTSKYGQKLIASSVVFPDLNNKELQDSYGVTNAEDLILEMIDNPGEFAEFQEFITKFNGFETDFEEEVEDAKN